MTAASTNDDGGNGTHDRREREWQLTATDLGAVHRWLGEHPLIQGLSIEHRSPQQVHDTYFDTNDWRFRRAGFALRVRSAAGESEATLKELRPVKGGLADRRELTEPMKDAASPEALAHSAGPVGTRVQAVAGTHALQALFCVDTTRRRFAVRKPEDDEDVGEITLDETIISKPDGEPQASARVVEVEARTDNPRSLQGLVKTLSDELALESATDSKYALGLRSVGLAPPQVSPPGKGRLDSSMRIDEVALDTLRRHLSAWMEHEPGARLGEDAEELHDLRVAGRRIYATLSLFAEQLPPPIVRMRGRLRQILDALGQVRDLDVQLASLREFARQLAADDRLAIEPLQHLLDTERGRARARMLRILDSPRTEQWLTRLRAELFKPAGGRLRRHYEPITVVAPELLQSRYRKVRKAERQLTADSSTDDYHRLRGRVKKLRYAVESVAAIYGKPADELLRSLRRIQDSLGEQQDTHVALLRLQGLARQKQARLSAETLFLMGRMAEGGLTVGARGRDVFHKRYPKLRKRWKRLRVELDQSSSQPQQAAAATSGPTDA